MRSGLIWPCWRCAVAGGQGCGRRRVQGGGLGRACFHQRRDRAVHALLRLREYRNGSTLYISYEVGDNWFFSVANDSWKLTEGGSFAIKFRVDRRGEIEGTGTALAVDSDRAAGREGPSLRQSASARQPARHLVPGQGLHLRAFELEQGDERRAGLRAPPRAARHANANHDSQAGRAAGAGVGTGTAAGAGTGRADGRPEPAGAPGGADRRPTPAGVERFGQARPGGRRAAGVRALGGDGDPGCERQVRQLHRL